MDAWSTAVQRLRQATTESAPPPPSPEPSTRSRPISRWFSSSFCLGSDYAGSVIGEDQWEWLEGQLEDSDASVHVLVSTLQARRFGSSWTDCCRGVCGGCWNGVEFIARWLCPCVPVKGGGGGHAREVKGPTSHMFCVLFSSA